jgi:hypothetical protein
MAGRSGKDKKLILVPNNVVNGLMVIANKQGKSFYSFVTETLEHALRIYTDGNSLEEIIDFYTLMGMYKSLGAKIISDDLFDYFVGKLYQTDKDLLQRKFYEFGQISGKNLASKHKDPIEAMEDLLKTAGWDLNEVKITKENQKVGIRCVSPILSAESTELLLKFIDGMMHEFGCKTQRQDYAKGIISLEYTTN